MIDDLIAEAERIAKPSLLLSAAPRTADLVGWWRGEAPDCHRGRDDDTHRISVDGAWLAQQGIRAKGVISVYDIAPKWGWAVPYLVEQMPNETLPRIESPGGIRLSGREVLSLPPLEALCLYGGPPVEEWLRSEGLERTDYDQAASLEPGAQYDEHYREQSPLYMDNIVAVLGGWHAMWPDDDFYIPREMRLALWTLRDSEPWIEVFERSPNLSIRVRIT